MSLNTITIGIRSDGQFSLTSSPDQAGPVQAQCFVFPRDTALWIAREITRLANEPRLTSSKESGT